MKTHSASPLMRSRVDRFVYQSGPPEFPSSLSWTPGRLTTGRQALLPSFIYNLLLPFLQFITKILHGRLHRLIQNHRHPFDRFFSCRTAVKIDH